MLPVIFLMLNKHLRYNIMLITHLDHHLQEFLFLYHMIIKNIWVLLDNFLKIDYSNLMIKKFKVKSLFEKFTIVNLTFRTIIMLPLIIRCFSNLILISSGVAIFKLIIKFVLIYQFLTILKPAKNIVLIHYCVLIMLKTVFIIDWIQFFLNWFSNLFLRKQLFFQIKKYLCGISF